MNFSSFFPDLLTALLSGVLLVFIGYIIREKFFPLPKIEGKWYLQMVTENTVYNPYRNMVLRYEVMIWRDGSLLKGSAEKYYEISTNGNIPYVGDRRVRSTLEGNVDKRYLPCQHQASLLLIESGRRRESSIFLSLNIISDKKMDGSFKSTVADQDGSVECQREPF